MSVASDTNVDAPLPRPTGPTYVGSISRGIKTGRTRSGGRVATLIAMLVSFTAAAVLQHVTQRTHHELVRNTGSEAKVSNLNSFSLALLLGGLRGPLVMLLWTSSESQKQEKNLADFDSKVELIRLLQPEFDSVHIFQIWNKAYNVSVQMANKANKYTTILDAIQYAYNVNQQHPDDINLLSQTGQIFFDKLGNSAEKEYYTERVRRESFLDVRVTAPPQRVAELDGALSRAGVEPQRREALVSQARRDGAFNVNKPVADELRKYYNGEGVTYAPVQPAVFNATGRRIRLDPILDLEGNFLPWGITPKYPRPANLAAGAEWNDGSEYQYLKPYAPYPYGVPPMAIGFDYYKRCQVLKDLTHQKHLQLSDLVVDNRPAINLKLWGEMEWATGRKDELRALGQTPSDDKLKNELPTATTRPSAPVVDRDAAAAAIYHYRLSAKIADGSEVEYVRHIRNYPSAAVNLKPHRQNLAAMKQICLGDADYLEAMTLPEADKAGREKLLRQAAEAYTEALYLWEVIMVEHFTADDLFAQAVKGMNLQGITKDNLDRVSRPDMHRLASLIAVIYNANPGFDTSDRPEIEQYVRRSFTRLANLDALPADMRQSPTGK